MKLSEIDDRCGSAILVLPKDAAVEVLQEFVTKKTRVRNPVAFLMGMLKSKRGDIPEGESANNSMAHTMGLEEEEEA